jgi:hypothetical protein
MPLWPPRLPLQLVPLLRLTLKSRHNQAPSNRLSNNQVKVPRLKLIVRCRAKSNPKSRPCLASKLRVNRLKKLTLKNRTTTNTTFQRSTRNPSITEEDTRDTSTPLCRPQCTQPTHQLPNQLLLLLLLLLKKTPLRLQHQSQRLPLLDQLLKLQTSLILRLNLKMSSISSLKMLMFQLMRSKPSLLRLHQLSLEIMSNLLLLRVSERL